MLGVNSPKHEKSTFRIFIYALITVFVFIASASTVFPEVSAADNAVTWERVNMPREGDAAGWILADGADIKSLTIAGDNTLYCYATPSGTSQTLYKSTDNGKSWSTTGRITDEIVDIAVVPGSSTDIYFATSSKIYKSSDAGLNFILLPDLPDSVGEGNLLIKCIDVCRQGQFNLIAAGTADSDNAEYGGIYILDENQDVPVWMDTNAGAYDVYSISFSPDYSNTGHLVAVVANETDTCVNTRSGNGDWNQDIGQAVIPGIVPVSAVTTFPDNYLDSAEDDYLFIGVNSGTGTGDVYRIDLETAPTASSAVDLNIGAGYGFTGVDIAGLDCGGVLSARLFAGAANSTGIYYSKDSGISWEKCVKPPTGQSNTLIAVDSNFSENSRVFAASTGTEGGLSCSTDSGISWNQISFIDTEISTGCIVDLIASPEYTLDKTLFILTFDSSHLVHSVWQTGSEGEYWERIYSSALENVDNIKKINISPLYGTTGQVVYLAGTYNGTPAIWKADNGGTFTVRYTPYNVDEWSVVDDEDLIIGCYNGTDAIVYKSSDSGQTFSAGTTILGNNTLTSISVSPYYSTDGTILAGNNNGSVYYSEDSGITFKPLNSEMSPISGLVHVAFDSEFETSRTVYAAGDVADNGIYRVILGESDEWDRIDGSLPGGGRVIELAISSNGVLYAVNSQSVDVSDKKGGMERCLNPSFHLSPTFETVVRGLDDNVKLSAIQIRGDRLWTIDTVNTRILTFLDTMTNPVALKTPYNGTAGMDTRNVLLDWETLTGATEYNWQVDYDGAFTSVDTDFEGDTNGSSIRLPQLDTDTRYHWRVRATKPVLSPWSDRWFFTTALGQTAIGPTLLSPGAGAELISPEPVFQWSAIAGAEKYELIVSDDIAFKNPAIKKTGKYALPATAWKSDITLEDGDTYYWKVRAVGSDTYGDWSAVSVFVTETEQASEQTIPDISVPILLSPGAGTEEASLKPLFQWDAIMGAESYELVVSADISFENPVIVKAGEYALPATAWKSNVSLDGDTAYYWKVRALVSGSYSNWSPVSAFCTDAIPETSSDANSEERAAALSSQPLAFPDERIPDWVVYLGIGLLSAIVLLQTTTLLFIVITRGKPH